MKSTNPFPKMHVSLYVNDIEQTVDFYDNFFKQSADKVKSGYAKYMLDDPALIISFVENKEQVKSKFGHLGFQVSSQELMNSELERLSNLGYDTLSEIGTACCYALQDKFWVSDPDGYRWEVYYFHDDVAFNDPHYVTSNTEACCSDTMVAGERCQVEGLQQVEGKKEEPCCEPGSGCC